MSQETTNHTFDELTRGLASGSISRGKALRLMGAALVGGTLASLGIGGEAAGAPGGCKREGKNCKRDTQCCSGLLCDSSSGTCAAAPPTCVSEGETCGIDTDCCSGLLCESGKCAACPSGQVLCPQGYCGRYPGGSCAAGELCCAGNCENGKCCVGSSVSCTNSVECCGSLICFNGSCSL